MTTQVAVDQKTNWISTLTWWKVFAIAVALQAFAQVLFYSLVFNEYNLYSWYSDVLNERDFNMLIRKTEIASHFSYLVLLGMAVLRVSIYGATFFTAGLLSNEFNLDSGTIVNIATVNELIITSKILLKTVYFTLVPPESVHALSMTPFSAYYLFQFPQHADPLNIILRQINIFEIASLLWFSYAISINTNAAFGRTLAHTTRYYLFLWIVWILIIVLATI